MDDVKVSLGSRGMTVEAAQQCTKDRNEWRAPVQFLAAILAWQCILSDCLLRSGGLLPGEGWDAVTLCSWGKL